MTHTAHLPGSLHNRHPHLRRNLKLTAVFAAGLGIVGAAANLLPHGTAQKNDADPSRKGIAPPAAIASATPRATPEITAEATPTPTPTPEKVILFGGACGVVGIKVDGVTVPVEKEVKIDPSQGTVTDGTKVERRPIVVEVANLPDGPLDDTNPKNLSKSSSSVAKANLTAPDREGMEGSKGVARRTGPGEITLYPGIEGGVTQDGPINSLEVALAYGNADCNNGATVEYLYADGQLSGVVATNSGF